MSGHDASHGHDHGARPRTATATAHVTHATRRAPAAIGIAALLTGGFMVAEVVGGLVAGSLALLADAGHMLTDFAALAMAWLAFRVARRPADAARTYGFDRLSVMAAFVNGLALFVVAAWIVIEAVAPPRAAPHPVDGGIDARRRDRSASLVNLARLLGALARRPRQPQPARRAPARRGDLLGSAGAIVAALVILCTGWTPDRPDPLGPRLGADPALGLARWCATAATSCSRRRPPDFDAAPIAADLAAAVPGVIAVRHLHAWSISEARPMVTLEAVIRARRRPRRRAPADQGAARRRASASTTPPSRSARTRTPSDAAVAAAGCCAYLGALHSRRGHPDDADQDPRDPARLRRAAARGRHGHVGGDGAAPGHPPAADRASQPDAEEGADRDPVRPASSARRRCRSSSR